MNAMQMQHYANQSYQSPASKLKQSNSIYEYQSTEVPIRNTPLIQMETSNPQSTLRPYVANRVESARRPLEIVDLFQVLDQWKDKIHQLESQLENLKKDHKPEEETLKSNSMDYLGGELSQVYEQIKQLQRSQKSLENDHQNLKETNQMLSGQINILQSDIDKKDNVMRKLDQTIEQLNNELDDEESNEVDRHAYLNSEVQTWKDKFIQLNREFTNTRQNLTLGQAEIDNLKQKSIFLVTQESRNETPKRRSNK